MKFVGAVNKMKGVSAVIGTVLVVVLSVAAVSTILLVGVPAIDRAKDSGVVNEAYQNMQVIDNLIRTVASEGSGSLRVAEIKVSSGTYRTISASGSFEYDFDLTSNLFSRGTYKREGNLQTIIGGGAKASENSTNLILENGILEIVLDKKGTQNNWDSINTSTLVKTVKIKSNGFVLKPNETSVLVGSQQNSSWGIGYSKLVSDSTSLAKAEAIAHVRSNVTNVEYEVLYTLPSLADFFFMSVRNVSDNMTTISFRYQLGTNSTDVIRLPNNETLFLPSGSTFTVTPIDNRTINLDATNHTKNASTLTVDLPQAHDVFYNASDGTWRNVTELYSLGQGNWTWSTNKTATYINYELAGSDGYDYGIRDALAGGSYWLDEKGNSLETGLVGYWKFGEGSGTVSNDSSGNRNDATWTNAANNVTWVTNSICKFGNCLSFDNSNDYITINDAPSLDLSGSYSISLWIKSDDEPTGNEALISKYLTEGTDVNYEIFLIGEGASSGQVRFQQANGAWYNTCDSTTATTVGKWMNIVGIYNDNTDTMKTYINGIEECSFAGPSSPATNNAPVYIGARQGGSLFDGHIDDVRIYNRVLSADEIKRLYQSTSINLKSDFLSAKFEPYIQLNLTNHTGGTIFQKVAENILVDSTPITTAYPVFPNSANITASMVYFFDWKENDWKVWQKNNYTDSLVGHWKFDEGQSNSAIDASSKTNNGVLGNSTSGTLPLWMTNSSCKLASCLYFDGSSDFVNISDSSTLDMTNAITISAWVKPVWGGGLNYPKILEKGNSEAYALMAQYNGDNKPAFILYIGGGEKNIGSPDPVGQNQWYHITGTYDGTQMKIYVDGILKGNKTQTGSIGTTNSNLFIGRDSSTNSDEWFNGAIDEVKVWNRALTPEEIKAEYSNSKRGMPDWLDPRFKQIFKWRQQFKGGNNPEINITYLMTAADPFVRIFVDGGPTGYASSTDSSTVGYWQFNEGSGTSTADNSQYGNTGTLTNGGTGSYQNVSWTTNCKIGNCLTFNGTNGYVSASNYINSTSSITFSTWFKLANFSSQNQWLIGTDDNTIRQCDFYVEGNSNKISFYCYNSNMDGATIQQSSAINTNQWYHAAGVYDTSSQKLILYVNGVNVMSTTYGSGLALHSGVAPNIGRSPYGNAYFNGTIDEVRIWNRSLTAEEIVSEYQRGLQHNITIPVSLGQIEQSEATADNGSVNVYDHVQASLYAPAIYNSSGLYITGYNYNFKQNNPLTFFYNSVVQDSLVFTTHNFGFGLGHNDREFKIYNSSSSGFDKFSYYYKFNSTDNNNFIFSLGYTGNSYDSSGWNTDAATAAGIKSNWGWSNETLEQVANSTLTYYDLLDNKLVGWWKFNENNNTITDYSGFNNTGTGYNGMQILTNSSCKNNFGYCAAFDGSNDRVNITSESSLDLSSDFSVSVWMKTSKSYSSLWTHFLTKESASPSRVNYRLYMETDNKVRFDIYDGSNNPTAGSGASFTQNDGVWRNYVAIRDTGTKTLKLYIDGTLVHTVADTTTGSILAPGKNLGIGWSGESSTVKHFDGVVDNVKIYSRVLSQVEISWEYNEQKENYPNWFKANQTNGATNIAATHFNYDGGATGVWHFDEGSGSIAADSSGNSNSGTLVNSPNITWPGSFNCKYGSCLNFTGSNGYVWLGQDKFTTAQTAKGTIEMWFNPATLSPSFQYLADFEGAIAIRLEPNQIRGYNDGSGGGVTYSVTQPNTWYHLAMAWDNSTNKMYVNGKQVSSVSANTYSLDSLTRNQTIGAQYVYANYFNGTMDEVKIYPRALADYEIWEHYSKEISRYYDDFNTISGSNSGKYRNYGVEDSNTSLQPVTPNATVLHLRFNDNSNANITDVSGFENNGGAFSGINWTTNSSCKTSFGGCVIFTGTGYMHLGNKSELNTPNQTTLSAWIYPAEATGSEAYQIVNKWGRNTGDNAYYLQLYATGGNLRAEFSLSPTGTDTGRITLDGGASTFPLNTWTHIAATYDGTTMRIFRNGGQISTKAGPSSIFASRENVHVGVVHDNDGIHASFFNGTIDEIMIINRSLSADEIYQLYLGGYNRTINGKTHRIASMDGVTTASYNLTDKNSTLDSQDYDMRILFVNRTEFNTTVSTFSPASGCYSATDTTNYYLCSYDNIEYSQAKMSGLIYSGRSDKLSKMCYTQFNTTNEYFFNISANGPFKGIIPVTNGVCTDIGNKTYMIEKQGAPSASFGTYAITGPNLFHLSLVYDKIKVTGESSISSGTHRLCIRKTGQEAGMVTVNVTSC